MLRVPITQLVQSVRSISYRDVRVDVGEQLNLIEQSTPTHMQSVVIQSEDEDAMAPSIPLQLEQIAQASPRATVIYIWSIVEQEVENVLQSLGKPIHLDESQKIRWLKKHKVLDTSLLKVFVDLKGLYEHVASESYVRVTPQEAMRYCELCQRIRMELTLKEKKHRS